MPHVIRAWPPRYVLEDAKGKFSPSLKLGRVGKGCSLRVYKV